MEKVFDDIDRRSTGGWVRRYLSQRNISFTFNDLRDHFLKHPNDNKDDLPDASTFFDVRRRHITVTLHLPSKKFTTTVDGQRCVDDCLQRLLRHEYVHVLVLALRLDLGITNDRMKSLNTHDDLFRHLLNFCH
jgi:hypothetical protein